MIEHPIVVAMWERELIRYRLRAAGVQIVGEGPHPTNPAAWVFTVHAAEGAAPPSVSRAAPARAVLPAFNWRVFVQLLCVLAIVGGAGYLGYSVFMGADLSAGAPDWGGLSQGARTAWDEIAAPWQPEPTPVPEPQTAPAPWWRFWNQEPDTVQAGESGGWTWPPRNPVGDAIDTAGAVIMWLVWALVAVGVLWLVSVGVGIVRRVRG